jgi:hypothetical protein
LDAKDARRNLKEKLLDLIINKIPLVGLVKFDFYFSLLFSSSSYSYFYLLFFFRLICYAVGFFFYVQIKTSKAYIISIENSLSVSKIINRILFALLYIECCVQ